MYICTSHSGEYSMTSCYTRLEMDLYIWGRLINIAIVLFHWIELLLLQI